jgi:thioredoxin-dependent peroxiredoxin
MSFKKAENFVLKDQDGNEFELYKNLNMKILLIFYPKDNSLVCSKQLKNYQENLNRFLESGIQPVAINIESSESHRSFCELKSIKFPVLSDLDRVVSKNFKALNFLSINRRKLVLIDTQHNIVYERNLFSFNYLNTSGILEELRSRNLIYLT